MPNPITSLVGGLLKPLGDVFKAREERKKVKVEAQATLDRILAEAAAADSTVAGQIALVNAQNQNATWKDEYALIVISYPFLFIPVSGTLEALGMFPPGTTDNVSKSMFVSLHNVPEWWSQTFQAGMLSALGITLWNKAKK